MSDLSSLVQALPGELYNKIYELTFTFNDAYTIKRKCRPPSSLQVNRETRSAHLKTYYSYVFRIESPNLIEWLASLNQRQIDMLDTVLLVDSSRMGWGGSYRTQIGFEIGDWTARLERKWRQYTRTELPKHIGIFFDSTLKFNVSGARDMRSGWWWSSNEIWKRTGIRR